MEESIKRIGVLTSGGDAPGMNNAADRRIHTGGIASRCQDTDPFDGLFHITTS